VTYCSYCHSLDGATLFYNVDLNKLRGNIKNKIALICAKFGVVKLQAVKQSCLVTGLLCRESNISVCLMQHSNKEDNIRLTEAD